MAGSRVQSKPNFRRQAILILLPVVVLAILGVMSLRQDQALAEHDARERARTIANDLVSKILDDLPKKGLHPTAFSFQVNEAGQLLFPPACAPVPAPSPFNLSELNPAQTQLWLKLRSANGTAADSAALAAAAWDFLDTAPPENFAAAAHYQLGLLLARQKKLPEAAAAFDFVAEKFPQAVGESGLPLRPMAQFQLFAVNPYPLATNTGITIVSSMYRVRNTIDEPGFAPHALEHFVSMDTLCSNIVYQPTLLTGCLLERIWDRVGSRTNVPHTLMTLDNETDPFGLFKAATPEVQDTVRKWRRTWDDHQCSRQLYESARTQIIAGIRSPLLADEGERQAITRLLAEVKSNSSNTVIRYFWFDTPEPWKHRAPGADVDVEERTWLAIPAADHETNRWIICLPEMEVASRISALGQRIPEYFGIGVELAGKRIAAFMPELAIWKYRQLPGGKGPGGMAKDPTGQQASTILATATSPEGGPAQLKINIYLTSPTALYQRQRIRAGWFGLVILASIAAALVGLVTGWRAFNRQQQLNELKSNFVSSVSHELRAPIASVRLLAESLERGKIQELPKQNEYFRFIVQECRRLSSLIENVLDFSRIEQGRKQYEFEPADLAALTRETVRLMEPYAAEKGVQLKVEMVNEGSSNVEHRTPNPEPSGDAPAGESGPFELEADGRAMQQALVNLIDNALKHSPKGESVTIGLNVSEGVSGARCQVSGDSTEASDPTLATSHVELYVEDHGPGIPPEEHEKIFERFYRRGSELRRETQGVGIGLSIVKHIVEAHGGRVVVRSAAGQGSRFTIELPMKNQ